MNFNSHIVCKGLWGAVTPRDRGGFHHVRDSSVLIPLTARNKIPFAINKRVIPEAQEVVTIATNHPNIILFCAPFVKPPFPQTICVNCFDCNELSFVSFSLFKLFIGAKKEVQKEQDANKPAVSSPKRTAASSTKLHSPGI